MTVTIVANGVLSMTIGEPANEVQAAGLKMVQDAIDLGRAVLRRSPEGIIIVIEDRKAGV